MLATQLWLLFSLSVASAISYIYNRTDPALLLQARRVGEQAKIQYFQSVIGVLDERERHDRYLDGLEKCDHIGSEQATRLVQRAEQEAKPEYHDLEKIGFKTFTAQFVTLPATLMQEVVHLACSKHEQQLECGAVFEGEATIQKRIEELKRIGNHRLMFNHECKEPQFASTHYPCLADIVPALRRSCGAYMDTYWAFREQANAKIAHTYDTSLNTVKRLKAAHAENQDRLNSFIFKSAMRQIMNMEGEKCGYFTKMQSCVLPLIQSLCGNMAAHIFTMSTTVGYLRTERHERLNLDFEVFQYGSDPRCMGL